MAAAGSGRTASNAASAVSVITASGTRPRAPCPVAATPSRSTAHSVTPETALVSPVPRPLAPAVRRASRVSSVSAAWTPVDGGADGAEGVQLGRAGQRVGDRRAQLAAGGRGALGRAAGRPGGEPGHGDPGDDQARGQGPGGRGQDGQHGAGGRRTDQHGGQRRRKAADKQVLDGVDVDISRASRSPDRKAASPAGASRSSRV